jgi:hypothetical protein
MIEGLFERSSRPTVLVGDSPYIDRIRVSGPADVVILVPSQSRGGLRFAAGGETWIGACISTPERSNYIAAPRSDWTTSTRSLVLAGEGDEADMKGEEKRLSERADEVQGKLLGLIRDSGSEEPRGPRLFFFGRIR